MHTQDWPDWYEDRWSWAAAATRTFQDELDPELAAAFDQRERPLSAVLVGPTQVGKTTLLLTMLGVAPQHFTSVSRLLRAGRVDGSSSTSVATRYHWSRSRDHWSYRCGDLSKDKLTDEDIVDLLANLRDGSGSPTGSLEVHTLGLPAGLRSADRDAVLPAVLDLPGIGASDPWEQSHASALAARYAPTAHIVIVVLDASEMTRLDEVTFLPAPELRAWTYAPERVRIVLTRTYTQEDYLTWLADHGGGATVAGLRDRAFRELATCDSVSQALRANPGLGPRIRQQLFPLEFGDSWEDLRRARPDEWRIAAGLVAELTANLSFGISRSAAQDTQHLLLGRAVNVIDELTRRELGAIRTDIREAAHRVSIAQRDLSKADGALKQAQAVLDFAEAVNQAITAARSSPPTVERSRVVSGSTKKPDGTGESMRDHRARSREKLRSETRRAWSRWHASPPVRLLRERLRVRGSDLNLDLDGVFNQAVPCCGDCSSVWFAFWTDDPDKCWGRQQAGAPVAVNNVNRLLADEAHKWLGDCQKSGRYIHVHAAQARLDVLREHRAAAQRDVERARAIEGDLTGRLQARIDATEQARTSATRLRSLLQLEASIKLKALDQAIARSGEDERIGLAVFGLVVLQTWFQMQEASL